MLAYFLFLPADLHAVLPEFMLKKLGTLSGDIHVDGQPVPNAIISFFSSKNGPPPVEGAMRRVPEFLTRTDGNGRFKTRLHNGEYYIGILIRTPDAGSGPPRGDEKFFFAGTGKESLRTFSIDQGRDIDVGIINGFSPDKFIRRADFFTVNGIVRDENGAPFPGVIVLGKSQLNIPRPGFISERTGEDGFYNLKLPAGGVYFLVSRETIAGGRPHPGNYVGTYGIKSSTGLATPSIFSAGSPPPGVLADDTGGRALTVSGTSGEVVSGADIFMYRVPDPEAIKSSIQGTTGAPQFEKGTSLNNILFSSGSSVLDESSFSELERWVSFLKGRDDLAIELSGYTDNVGSLQINKDLSGERARAVANFLAEKGVMSQRVTTVGHGADHPVASNDTEEGRKQNRRVEIKFVSKQDSVAVREY